MHSSRERGAREPSPIDEHRQTVVVNQGPPPSVNFDYGEAFSRNIGLVSTDEQILLRDARVAIAGLGGVGGVYLMALARLGIGGFALAEFDRFELANMNRQVGATMETLGRLKIDVAAEMATAINPTCQLRLFPEGLNESTVDAFLDSSAVAVDGIDFFGMDARRLLFRKAKERGIYAVTAGPVGFGSALLVFSPTGMSFEEYFDLREGMTLPEQIIQLGLGLTPKLVQRRYFRPAALDLHGQRVPSLGPACLLCAALVATEVVNLILHRRPPKVAPCFAQFDPYVQTYKTGRLPWGNRNPIQRVKRWWVLRTNPSLLTAIQQARREPVDSGRLDPPRRSPPRPGPG